MNGLFTLPAAAMTELKAWVRVTTGEDDDQLAGQLRAAIGMCEQFTGSLVLMREMAVVLAVRSGWIDLPPRPVRAILSVSRLDDDMPTSLTAGEYEVEIDTLGNGRVWVHPASPVDKIEVELEAGLTADWNEVPEPLRQGIVRLAGHLYLDREGTSALPAAVNALWRPFRRLSP